MIKEREYYYYPTSSYGEPGLTALTHKIRIYPNKTNQDKLSNTSITDGTVTMTRS